MTDETDKHTVISPTGRCTFPDLIRPREQQDRVFYFSTPMPSLFYEDHMRALLDRIAASFGMPYEYAAGQARAAYDYSRHELDAKLRTAAQGQWSAPRYMAEVISRPPKFEKRRTARAWNILIICDWIKANFKPALKENLRWDHMPLHPDFYADSTMRMRRMLQRVFDPFGFDLIGQSVVGLYSEWLRRDVSPTTRSLSAYHSNVRLGTPYLPPRKGKS